MRRSKRLKPFSKGATLVGRHALYAKEEELLWVEGYYVEKYRHFPYQDIQALFWKKDRTTNALLLSFTALFVLISLILYLNDDRTIMWIFLIMGSIPLLSFLSYAVRGGKIIAYITTPVQQMKLTSIQTKRTFNKLVKLLDSKGIVPSHDNIADS